MKCRVYARLFSNPEFKKYFLDGKLWMSSLAQFKLLEDNQNTKGDRLEGVSSYYQPKKLDLVFTVDGINHKISDAVGPILVENPEYGFLKVYCFYSPELNTNDLGGKSQQILPPRKMIDDFGDQLVWIHNIREFRRRVEIAIEKRKDSILFYKADNVLYFEDQFHGRFDEISIPFRKHEKFSFQKEFRVVLRTKEQSDSEYILDIGDIRDICTEMNANDFDENNMEVSFL